MDLFRYIFALLMLMTLPPSILYWFVVHPFIGYWRRRGPAVTYTVLGIVYVVLMAIAYLYRDALLVGDYGTNYVLIAVAVPFLAASVVIQFRRKKMLKFKTLAGLPELSPETQSVGLLTDGIYARIRHPRYVEFTFGILGWSLILNYLAVYLLTAASMVALYLIVLLEERELHQRFGDAYAEYCVRVPRFLPRRQP